MQPALPTAADASRHAWRCAAAALAAAALVPTTAAAIPGRTHLPGLSSGSQHHSTAAPGLDGGVHQRMLAGIDYEYSDDYDTFYMTMLGAKYPTANQGKSNPWDYELPGPPPPANDPPKASRAANTESPASPQTSPPPTPPPTPPPSPPPPPPPSPPPPRSPGENWDSELTYEEEIEAECTVNATAEEVENFSCGSVHADAIAEVFRMACDGKGEMLLEDIEEVFMAQDAVAFAQATATAMVDCMSDSEDAFLCASVTISSEAFANTTVQAHVSAMASALDGCDCMGDTISSFITAESFISLVAEASATATASACIEGRGRVVQTVYESCSTTVFARVFARAAAEAILEGECLDSVASAGLLLATGAMNITAESTCGGLAIVTEDGVPLPIDS